MHIDKNTDFLLLSKALFSKATYSNHVLECSWTLFPPMRALDPKSKAFGSLSFTLSTSPISSVLWFVLLN